MKQLFSWFFIRSGCYPAGIDEVAAGFYLGALHTRESLQPLHQKDSLNQNEWVRFVFVNRWTQNFAGDPLFLL